MRSLAAALLAALPLVACAAGPETADTPRADAAALVGTWTVDLRPMPDAEPYFKTFVVERVEGRTLAGSFYDSEVTDGHVNADWGAVHFAFTTSDGVGEYHTAGVLEGGRLRGTTHAVGRGFLAVWSAERAPRAD